MIGYLHLTSLSCSRSTKLTALKMDVSNLPDSPSTPPSPLTGLGRRTGPNGTRQNGGGIQGDCRPSCDQVTQSSEETDLTSPRPSLISCDHIEVAS